MVKIDSDIMNKFIDNSYDILKYILKYNEEYKEDIGMCLVSLAGFLIYYSMNNIDTIINAYKNTKYTTTKEELKLVSYRKETLPSDTKTTGLYIPHITLFGAPNGKKVFIDDELKLRRAKKQSEFIYLLNFIHEMNHIIKSQNKRILYNDSKKLIYRNGIIINEHNLQTLTLESASRKYTEEGLNQLQTEEILEIITSLCGLDIKNKYAREYLNKIREEINTYGSNTHYKRAMDILNPLYENPRFRDDYTSGCITGNIENVADNFDYYVGNGAFEELTSSVDEYYYSNFQDEHMKKAVRLVVNYQLSKKK